MDTKQLKQKILDLAIRGKLVPQDPNDEPASVLLERIRKEKEQLIASGKLKKTKSKTTDTPHYENVPFEIPDSWEWVRLENLYNAISAKRVLQADWKREGVPFYRAREIVKLSQYGFVKNDLFITEEHYQSLKAAYGIPLPNDIMLSAVGTIGKTYIVKESDKFYYKDASVLCLQNLYDLYSEYIQIALNSPIVQGQMHGQSKGTTVDTITIEKVGNYILPFPPLAEQKRIVAEIEKWFALIDEIEANKQDLQEYIKQVKSKVLDLAIHGKLVPQDPNDEPAIELLHRINPSFKPCDTSHYENLPSGWASVMLLDICKIDTGKWDANHASINGKYRFYTCSAQFSYSDTKRFSGECLIIPGNGDIGQVYYYDGDFDAYQRTYVLSHILIYSKYLYYHLLSNWRNVNTDKQFGSTIKFVRIGNFQNYIVLLPPLAEQKRIVERIETIFAQLDTITAEL